MQHVVSAQRNMHSAVCLESRHTVGKLTREKYLTVTRIMQYCIVLIVHCVHEKTVTLYTL